MEVDREQLRAHVAEIARTPRPAESPALDRARDYVCGYLQRWGWDLTPHAFTARSEEGASLSGVNVIARHPRQPAYGGPRVCIGAHLDSRVETPGADDNASAVAVLLEIARLLPVEWPREARLEVELVVFDLEEHGMLGGAEHARLTKSHGIDLRGMVSLEMLGYCDHRPKTQALPRALAGLYPTTGNFIAIVGNQNSAALIERWRQGMQSVAGLPVEWLAVPANGEYLQATRLSDHSPFWDAGYSALMITDTSFLRNPHYHLPSDTMDTLDFEFLHKVGQGCFAAVWELIGGGV